MLSLVIVALATIASGFIVWGTDRHRGTYGISLPAGVSVAVAMLSWMIFIQLGFGYQPGVTWIPWVLPIILGTVAAAVASYFLGRHRTRHDTAQLTAALRL
jgi:sterol desaturase/sphingolipid hydroxylase (fatty acid hydroxylase superfamily)